MAEKSINYRTRVTIVQQRSFSYIIRHGANEMPEIKISHPTIMIDLTDISKRDAITLRGLLTKYFKVRSIDAHVGYSDTNNSLRVVVRSVDASMRECTALVHDAINIWLGEISECESISTKRGRTIRWPGR